MYHAKWLKVKRRYLQVLNVAYWDWNANSGDTGGIVDDSWVNILWTKVQWMIDTVQLQPWYLTTSSVSFLAA